MKKENKKRSSADIYGSMDAWCRGISEVYNRVDAINMCLPARLVSVRSSPGSVDICLGGDTLLSFPCWDLEALDMLRPRLDSIADFAWSMYKLSIFPKC